MMVTCNRCWRPCRLLPLVTGRRMKFERDSLPATAAGRRVGYTVGLQLTDAGTLVRAAYPAVDAAGVERVLLPHTCDRDRRGQDGAVELVAA